MTPEVVMYLNRDVTQEGEVWDLRIVNVRLGEARLEKRGKDAMGVETWTPYTEHHKEFQMLLLCIARGDFKYVARREQKR